MGIILLNSIRNFCRNNSIREWNIKALPNEKLIEYYENYGFERGDKIFDQKGNFKVQKMRMVDFGEEYEEEDYEDKDEDDDDEEN